MSEPLDTVVGMDEAKVDETTPAPSSEPSEPAPRPEVRRGDYSRSRAMRRARARAADAARNRQR